MDFVRIGKLGASHGLKGELKLVVEELYLDNVEDLKAVFLEQKGNKMPYFVEGIRGEYLNIIKLEEIDDVEAAKLLSHKDLYARAEDLGIEADELPDDRALRFSYLEGYTVIDEELGEIGKIIRVEEYPQQEMAIILYQEREVLIPLHPQFITNKDKKNKTITCSLPEGLLDL